jgi:hypothetical protein
MHLCQNLEQMTGANRAGRRYRQDWRVVTYKVAVDPWSGELRWERLMASCWETEWRGWVRGRMMIITAAQRAMKRHGDKTVVTIDRVRHLSKVTKADASKLTGLPAFNAIDYLKETTLPDDDRNQNYVKLAKKAKTARRK